MKLSLKHIILINGLFLISATLQSNRSFIIGCTVALLFTLFIHYRKEIKKNHLIAVLVFFIFFISMLAIYWKPESSQGRLLVYKITTKILKDNYLQGIGYGNFASEFGQYQINYFKSDAYTQKELLLADNTKHAFNDYLQFITIYGVGGFSVLILLMVYSFKIIKRGLLLIPLNPVFVLMASPLITIVVATLFTHVFEKPLWQLLAFLSFSYLLFYTTRTGKLIPSIFVSLGVVLIIAFNYGPQIIHFDSYNKADEAAMLSKAGYNKQAIEIFEKIYPVLKHDNMVVFNYAKALLSVNRSESALPLLEELILKDKHSLYYSMLAKCYEKEYQFDQAEEAYKNAIFRVPNRLTTREDLFLFYIRRSQLENAINMGMEILSLPIKIPSNRADNIKNRVRLQLQFVEARNRFRDN